MCAGSGEAHAFVTDCSQNVKTLCGGKKGGRVHSDCYPRRRSPGRRPQRYCYTSEKPARSPAEVAYLGALTDLEETYASEHVVVPASSRVDALRYLMDENGLSQADLLPLFGATSTILEVVSEVLAGKRSLSLAHITRPAAHFGLPVDVFIGSPRQPRP